MKTLALHKPAPAEIYLRVLVWLTILMVWLASIIGMYLRDIHLNPNNGSYFIFCYYLFFVVLPMAASLLLRYKKPSEQTAYEGMEALAQFMALLSPVEILSYTVVQPIPYCDAALMNIDKAMGFNWLGYLTWVNRHSAVSEVLFDAYASGFPQMVAAIVTLAVVRQFARMYGFTLAIVLCAIITVGISSFFPAIGTYSYLHLNSADYPNVYMKEGYLQVDDLNRLHGGTLRELSSLRGLITFPSFHAATAITLMWAFWSIPWLRWPLFLLNILVLAATPINGCHYLVDVIAGAVIAAIMICVVKLIIKSANGEYENTCPL